MKKSINKKKWKTPAIKVLHRGENKENVLCVCKKHCSLIGGGPSSYSNCLNVLGYICQTDNPS